MMVKKNKYLFLCTKIIPQKISIGYQLNERLSTKCQNSIMMNSEPDSYL